MARVEVFINCVPQRSGLVQDSIHEEGSNDLDPSKAPILIAMIGSTGVQGSASCPDPLAYSGTREPLCAGLGHNCERRDGHGHRGIQGRLLGTTRMGVVPSPNLESGDE